MTRILDVYMESQKAGELSQEENGSLSFSYDKDYLHASKIAISISMPLREDMYPDNIARPYFSGLLPDENARRRLASVLGISSENSFGLLEIIGGECAGALTLLPHGAPPPDFTEGGVEVLGEKRLIDILRLLRERPLLGGQEGVRISLAGAQDKIAVCLVDEQIALAKGGTPTTHILKPFIVGLEGTVENEFFCMKLAERVGLEVPKVSKGSAGDTGFILVERYDRMRSKDGKDIRKIHQEDFCQALSVPPELKYEEEGGPGIRQAQDLIRMSTRQPAADLLKFHRMIIFNYLVGNADAHAKNYAFLYREKAPDLAPLYDVICTAAYPRIHKNLAMKIGGRAVPDTIRAEQWYTLVPPTKVARRLLNKDLFQMADRCETEAEALAKDLQGLGIAHPILKSIRKTLSVRATHIRHMLESADKSEE